MHMAGSLHCMAETNTNYKAIIQKKKKRQQRIITTYLLEWSLQNSDNSKCW